MASVSQKRKRESIDDDGPILPPGPVADFRASPNGGTLDFGSHYDQSQNEGDMPPHFADQLLQHNAGDHQLQDSVTNGQSASDTANAALHYSMTVPQSAEDAFLAQAASVVQRESSAAFTLGEPTSTSEGGNPYSEFADLEQLKDPSQQGMTEASPPVGGQGPGPKLAVGTPEWHKKRRDDHKEVERRRRETINEGINELANIVPGCDKNKGSILQRAVQYISQLKQNETDNIQKWSLEKLLTEQALSELSQASDKMKAELNRTYKELEEWRRCAQRAGVQPTNEDRAAAAESTAHRDD